MASRHIRPCRTTTGTAEYLPQFHEWYWITQTDGSGAGGIRTISDHSRGMFSPSSHMHMKVDNTPPTAPGLEYMIPVMRLTTSSPA